MDDRTNTIAGWVLGAGIVALGASIMTGEVFSADRPEKMGYPIEGVELEGDEGAEAEQPIAAFLAAADVGRGEAQFRKCAACHTIDQGGATGLGPNLWGMMGRDIASIPGFAYSDALTSVEGSWTWDAMSEWIKSPRNFAPNTKMTFAGISSPEDRADLLVYMNAQGSNLPLPPPPAADTPAEVAAESADQPAAAGKGESEPIITEGDAAQQPKGNVGGEGTPEVSGRAGQTKVD